LYEIAEIGLAASILAFPPRLATKIRSERNQTLTAIRRALNVRAVKQRSILFALLNLFRLAEF
jgi:hypothetical protein